MEKVERSHFLRIHVLVFVLIIFVKSQFAQIQNETDASLAEIALKESQYNLKIPIYNNLIAYYSRTSLEKARVLSIKMIAEARLHSDLRTTADGLNLLGRTFVRMGLNPEAEQTFLEALKVFQNLKNDTGIAAQYGNLGVVYDLKGDYKLAVASYYKALKIYEKLNDIKSISFIENNLGIVYQELSLFNQAFSFQQKALEHKRQLNDTSGMASTLNNIGVLYESLTTDLDSSLWYYKYALKLFQITGNNVQTATLLNNIGLIYLKMDSLEKATAYLNNALVLRKELKDFQGEASTLLNLTHLAIRLNKFREAVENAKSSLNIFELMNSKPKISEAYHTLAQAYEGVNNYTEALKYFKLHMAYKDTLLNESNQKAIHEMQAKYELDANLNKIALLAKDNALKEQQIAQSRIVLAGIIITSTLILFLALFFIRNFRLKQKQQRLLLEQRLFRSQMNPHFIFNALTSIQNFVQNNSLELGSKYITQFARLMRKILVNSGKEYVPLDEELEVLNDYITFQKLRFSDAFIVTFDIDEAIESEFVGVPPMLFQPFIENAIEHGVRQVSNGEILIKISQHKRNLKVSISDNGIGIHKSIEQKAKNKHQSMALQITKERLLLLSKAAKSSPYISIVDKSDIAPGTTGTVISFELPVINIL